MSIAGKAIGTNINKALSVLLNIVNRIIVVVSDAKVNAPESPIYIFLGFKLKKINDIK